MNGDRLPSGWETVQIGEVVKPARRAVAVESDTLYREIGIRSHGKGIFYKELISGKDLGDKRVFWIEPGCFVVNIVFAWEGAVAQTTQAESSMIASHRFPMYKPDAHVLDLDFMTYFFKSKRGIHLLGLASPGGAGRNKTLGQQNFLELEIPLPPLGEQKKIAEILSTWDEAIDLTEQLIAAKQRRKKALMQRLLTGQVRFPGFEDEWKEYQLGNLASLTAGGTPSTKIGAYWDGNIRWMNSGEINLRYIYEVEGRITKEGLDSSSAKLIPPNSVLIALAGQGKTRGMVAINKIETATNQSIAAIMPDPTQLNYLYLFFNLDNRYNEMRVLSGGDGGRGGLNLTILKNVIVSLPSLQEQKKIADILMTCDQELDLLQQKLTALRRHKQGLMQQLLTGRLRVKV